MKPDPFDELIDKAFALLIPVLFALVVWGAVILVSHHT